MAIKWTAEELAALEAYDEEVDADETPLVPEPASDVQKKPAKQTHYQRHKRERSAYQARYYRENKEVISRRSAERYRRDPQKVLAENRARLRFNATLYAEEQAVIAQARRAAGLTQKALAQMVGVSDQTICNWEKGYTKADWVKLETALPKLREWRNQDGAVVFG